MATAAPTGPQIGIERIYLRDLSFESPKAPGVFASQHGPQVHVEVNTRAMHLDANRFEVVLMLTVEAKTGEGTLLVVELQQGGVFHLSGMDEPVRRQALAVVCPNILFPYARETIDTLAVKGAFPPFVLAPVNFEALYAEARARHEAEQDPAAERWTP